MKRMNFILVALLASALSCTTLAQETTTSFEQQFAGAQAAYDAGKMPESIELFQGMIDDGNHNVEVLYNLANAYFKNGNLPEAVWYYRHAWYLSPRDPDIQANLRFALNAANAVEPAPSFIEKAGSMLSSTEWMMAAIACYILLTIILALAFIIRPLRKPLMKVAIIPGVCILLATAGWWHWMTLSKNPEVVIVRSGATALFSPIEGTTAHYKIPAAAIAQQISINPRGWVHIRYDGKEGWLKKGFIKPVYP